YASLDGFLNPRGTPRRDLFTLKAVLLLLRYGMPALKQTVAGGQYAFPKGLFFGGKCLQQELESYSSFLRERAATARRVVAIDVHTGLGRFAEDTLFIDKKDYARAAAQF